MNTSISLIQKIDVEIERRSLLKHRFYQMWSQGQLNIDHLQGYAKEYFQLVKAVPSMVDSVADAALFANQSKRPVIQQNAAEEREHVLPWIEFANSLGIPSPQLKSYEPCAKTQAAVEALQNLSRMSFEESVATMYAYEAELPKISRSKIDGLKKFYGLDTKDALNYFEIHEEADVRHAQIWREILSLVPEERQAAALDAATKSLEAQNLLLDSVMDNYVGVGAHC